MLYFIYMKLVYFKAENKTLNSVFGVDNSEEIPVIVGTTLEVSSFLFHSAAVELNHELNIFVPGNIRDDFYPGIVTYKDLSHLQWDSRDLTVITTALELPTELIELHNVHYLMGNPGKLYRVNNSTYIGYITASELSNFAPDSTPTALLKVDSLDDVDGYMTAVDNILHVVGHLDNVQNIDLTTNKVYGKPHVKGNVRNSTLTSPIYICENSVVFNSYIAPGSVIINSVVKDSKLFSSVVVGSEVSDSELEGTLVSGSKLEGHTLSNSTVPYNSVLNARKSKI